VSLEEEDEIERAVVDDMIAREHRNEGEEIVTYMVGADILLSSPVGAIELIAAQLFH